MHAHPVVTTALSAAMTVSVKRFSAMRLPLMGIWFGFSAAPKGATLASVYNRFVLRKAGSFGTKAPHVSFIVFHRFFTNCTANRYLTGSAPSSFKIAGGATVFSRNFREWDVERLTTALTFLIFAIFRTVSRKAFCAFSPNELHVSRYSKIRSIARKRIEHWERGA